MIDIYINVSWKVGGQVVKVSVRSFFTLHKKHFSTTSHVDLQRTVVSVIMKNKLILR